MLRSLVLGQRNAGTDFWGADWGVATIWTLAGKSLVAVYGQGETCPISNIILKIGHVYYRNGKLHINMKC